LTITLCPSLAIRSSQDLLVHPRALCISLVIVQICSICTRARCSDLLDRQLEHCRAFGANGNLCARHDTYRTMAPFVAWSRTRHGSLDLCAIARATASRVCDCAHEGGRSVRD